MNHIECLEQYLDITKSFELTGDDDNDMESYLDMVASRSNLINQITSLEPLDLKALEISDPSGAKRLKALADEIKQVSDNADEKAKQLLRALQGQIKEINRNRVAANAYNQQYIPADGRIFDKRN